MLKVKPNQNMQIISWEHLLPLNPKHWYLGIFGQQNLEGKNHNSRGNQIQRQGKSEFRENKELLEVIDMLPYP